MCGSSVHIFWSPCVRRLKRFTSRKNTTFMTSPEHKKGKLTNWLINQTITDLEMLVFKRGPICPSWEKDPLRLHIRVTAARCLLHGWVHCSSATPGPNVGNNQGQMSGLLPEAIGGQKNYECEKRKTNEWMIVQSSRKIAPPFWPPSSSFPPSSPQQPFNMFVFDVSDPCAFQQEKNKYEIQKCQIVWQNVP